MAALRNCVQVSTFCQHGGRLNCKKILSLKNAPHAARSMLEGYGMSLCREDGVIPARHISTCGMSVLDRDQHVCSAWRTARRGLPGLKSKSTTGYFISNPFTTSIADNTTSGDGKSATQQSSKSKEKVGIGAQTDGTKNTKTLKMPNPDLEWEFIMNPDNEESIQRNISDRKGVGDIKKVKRLWNKLNYPEEIEDEDHEDKTQIKRQLVKEAMELPNRTHPDVPIGDDSQNRLVETVGTKRVFTFQPKSVVELGEELGMLRMENLGNSTSRKSYYLMGGFAQMEQALVRFTVDRLEKRGFSLVSVPDLIHPDIIERCGFKTTGDRTQVFKLDPNSHGQVALAGTGEMPIVGMFMGQKLDVADLPKKVMTVSRCFRAETSDVEEERGIYRVHHFTKVESFGVTSQETGLESEELLTEVLGIQKSLFSDLGLHFRILDMASQELGAPAHRKFDMEAWMPAKQFWGEISSTSNCIDYQSRRLGIKYSFNGSVSHAHTLNGTACAIPRMIMAIVENNQLEDGRVKIPEKLQPYMNGMTVLEKPKQPLITKLIRLTKLYKTRSKSS